MDQEDVRAIISMELRQPTWHEEARALQLCIRHLIRDAESLDLQTVTAALSQAVSAIDLALAAKGDARA